MWQVKSSVKENEHYDAMCITEAVIYIRTRWNCFIYFYSSLRFEMNVTFRPFTFRSTQMTKENNFGQRLYLLTLFQVRTLESVTVDYTQLT
jgi:hypothetical protein